MRHIDLFSGIGGFALAASLVWPDHEVVTFCDIEPFAHKVLAKHWPNVPISHNIFDLKGDQFGTVDLVTGGFPCQPFSQAGKREGRDDDRYLWPEMLRIVTEARPRWVIGENVDGLFTIESGLAFERVCLDLETLGYEVQPFRIPACATGAPHRRDRWWFVAGKVANADQVRRDGSEREDGVKPSERRLDALDDLATDDSGQSAEDVATDAKKNRDSQFGRTRAIGQDKQLDISHRVPNQWSQHWLEVASEFCRVDDGVSGGVDRNRKHRIAALGNAIVPQVAYQIMLTIKECDQAP